MNCAARCPGCSGLLPSPGGACPRCADRIEAPAPHLPSRYQPLEKLGTGRLGDVFRCRDGETGRDVVVKVLRPGICADRDAMYLLRRNLPLVAAALAGHGRFLEHHGLESTGEGAVLVQEFAPGGTLRDRMNRECVMAERECRRIGVQIAEALSVVHERKLHFRLRPQNVLFDSEGNVRIDFDLGRVLREPHGEPLDENPRYLSPEEILGQKAGGAKDIYALGCILHHMATGRPPFLANTPQDLLAKLSEPPPDPRKIRADLSGPFAMAVQALLATRPEHRPPGGAACAALLRDQALQEG